MTMGQKIYNLRKLAEFSQEILAEKLNVSRQTVSKWERDECQPELDKVIAISQLFDITTDELLLESKQPKINTTLQELVDNNQLLRKKRIAIKTFLVSLVFLLLTIGLTPIMQLFEKTMSNGWNTNMLVYLNKPPLSIFLWVSIIGIAIGIIMYAYYHSKSNNNNQ